MTNDRTRIIACSKPWRSSAGLRTTRCTCAHLDKAAANLQESSVFQNRTMRANAHRRRWARNDFTFAPAMYLAFSIHKPASPSVPDLMDGPSWTNNRRELSIVQLHTSSNAVRRPHLQACRSIVMVYSAKDMSKQCRKPGLLVVRRQYLPHPSPYSLF